MRKIAKKPMGIIFVLTLTISFLAVIYFGGVSILKTLYPCRYSNFVELYTEKNNLSEEFVYAVIKCESNFDADAQSYLGAKGLMQIMPETFDWLQWRKGESLSYESLYDPETSIRYGCYFYGYLMEKFADESTAVAAYHAGSGCVEQWLSDKNYSDDGKTLKEIPYPSTKEYVEKVIRTKAIYQKLYQ